jgi:tellurite resistance protein
MLTCLALIVKADENITDKENEEVLFQIQHILDLSPEEIKKGMMKPADWKRVLDSMSSEELAILGILMGRIAGSDGRIDHREIDSIKSILKIARLNPEIIQAIIDNIEVK